MAGYTAANNILGFLYVSVNAVTQACMSFTSQNYSVKKPKRMDRVLLDCIFLSAGIALVLGVGAWVFGSQVLRIYTTDADVIQCGLEILSITTVPYFLCGIMDLFPEPCGAWDIRQFPWYYLSSVPWHKNSLDLWIFPAAPFFTFSVYFVSRFLDCHHRHAGRCASSL